MERYIKTLEPIQRAGMVLHKCLSEVGINDVYGGKMDKVELVFRKLLKVKSFRSIILNSEPQSALQDEKDIFLVFAPSTSPENSLCWVVWREDSTVPEEFGSDWKERACNLPHYEIFDKRQVSACVDRKARQSLKTHDGHFAKPHT